jgi:hypothetical protein
VKRRGAVGGKAAVSRAVLGAGGKRCSKYDNQRNHCQTFHGYIVLLPLKTRAIYERFGIAFFGEKYSMRRWKRGSLAAPTPVACLRAGGGVFAWFNFQFIDDLLNVGNLPGQLFRFFFLAYSLH